MDGNVIAKDKKKEKKKGVGLVHQSMDSNVGKKKKEKSCLLISPLCFA